MSQSASDAFEAGVGREYHGRGGCSWGKSRWSFWEFLIIVGGFVLFWPVGLVALFWKFKKGELWPGSADSRAPWAGWRGFDTAKWRWPEGLRSNSGNSAFEAYKARELEKRDDLRRSLVEEQKAFADFLDRLERAKDHDEFDRFMAEREAQRPPQE